MDLSTISLASFPQIPAPPEGARWTLPQARRFCTYLADGHYENFPVGSRWIPGKVRPHVHAIYAFSRTADDFADEAEHAGARLERLGQWRKLLYEAVEGKAEHPIFVALADSVLAHDIPVEWLDHLIRAFEQDVRQNRHPNFASIVEYAKLSADPVGRLVLWLHGYRDEELFRLSDDICSALQFANFWQDVAVDWKKDRVYLPQDDMARFGYTEADLAAGIVDDRFRGLLDLEIERTLRIFNRGRSLCDRVGDDLRKELRLVWCGGTRILELIRKNDYDVFRYRPALRTWDKGVMLWRMLRWPKGRPELRAGNA
ncbi:MAG TPA: squalene synthase HpnC [Bdellovibrionota bacterium]|nr:squalene synthase HpnC [Bdellovibrionota bacterium]